MHNESIKIIVKVTQKFELLVVQNEIQNKNKNYIYNMSNMHKQSFQFTHSNKNV